ncbi:hypothetical protein HDU98_011662 [Podochytrium sp. JEL0797]|nr:hypothetical protein HDU98_011662 [Podochytrium sp. JEL0797]
MWSKKCCESTTTKTITKVDGTSETKVIKTITTKYARLPAVRPGPHEDFYKYANHAWIHDPTVVIPPEYSSWGSFMKLRDTSLKNQLALLQELVASEPANIDEAKIAAVWKASMDRFSDWAASTGSYAPVEDSLALINSFLSENITDEGLAGYFAASAELGVEAPLQFEAMASLEDSTQSLLALMPSGLSLPTRDFYFEENFQDKRDFFLAHLTNVANLVGADRLVPDFANAVMRFETKLAEISMKSHQGREFTKFYTKSTLDSFISGINELNSLEEKQANYGPDSVPAVVSEEDRIRIAAFMESIYEKANLRATLQANYAANYPEGSADLAERVTVFDGDFFRRVFAILFDEANQQDLLAYLQYKAIKSAKSFCTKDLDEEFFDLYARKLNGQKEQKSDEKRSVGIVDEWVGFLLGKVYVSRYFTETDKERVSGMIDEVVAVMDSSIARNDWLTSVTKGEAKLKLDAFKTKIGYPDVWKSYDELNFESGDSLWDITKRVSAFKHVTDFQRKINAPVDKTEWFMGPQTVNAYYNPMENEICFPAAIIQPPFYAKNVDAITFTIDEADRALVADDEAVLAAVNFGGIAAVIAHEITHGFDDQGRNFDGAGTLRDWWTEEDTTLFQAKCDLMLKQEWSFVEESTGKTHALNPKLTMGENLADLGGISLGIQALLRRVEGASDEQRKAVMRIFFSSWANIWTTKATDAFLVNQLASDPHSPGQVRCNLVKNIDQFYQAYEVKEGDAMYLAPEERVAMW